MAEISAELPQEIISEILVRLPAKSIGRSRCVSKPWLSLLTTYDFIKAHLAHHTRSLAQEQKFLILTSSHSLNSLTLHLGGNHLRKLEFFDEQVMCLSGSSNGLVLVESKVNVLSLINCLTQECLTLPALFADLDPYTFISIYGFGYDSLSNDYKIVSISKPKNGKADTLVDIYSLKMRSWRRSGTCPYDFDILYGLYVNGALHWTQLKSSDNESVVIVAFDLSSERFYEILAPTSMEDSILMEIDGCLGIAVKQYSDIFTEIWYMKSCSLVESWTKLVIETGFMDYWWPDCFHQDKILFSQADGSLKWYYLQDGRVEVCLLNDDHTETDDGVSPILRVITYSESLVSPHFNYLQDGRLEVNS